MKTNIKMRVTPEQSKKVQEICFENGIYWADENKDKVKVRVCSSFLYIRGLISHNSLNNFTYFKEAEAEEIDADLFIRTNGTCEETYLAKYTSQPKDLESALKKIENLHIALNKKVDKNKNQALEITKLLEQKKDLKEINDTQNIYIKNLENYLEDYKKCKKIIKKYNFIDERSECVSKILQCKYDYIAFSISRSNDTMDKKNNQWNIIKELEQQLKEKDTIIPYLESKLK
jgi:hypothetical protein